MADLKRVCLPLALCLVLASAVSSQAGELRAEEAARRMDKGQLTLIDVRSPAEWRQTGVPAGSKRVTIHDEAGWSGFLSGMLRAVDGDRSKPVGLICARGGRSKRAYEFLVGQGFSNLHNVGEGMLGNGVSPGWIARGLPVEPCRTC